MISTVTTSTVSSINNLAIAGSLALIGILILLALLVLKELSIAEGGARFSRLSRALNIGLLPLLFAFVLIVVVKVAEVLR